MNKGMPRPRAIVNEKSYPMPYTADEDSISRIDGARMLECLIDQLCMVCGRGVDSLTHVMLKNGNLHGESGPFHEGCLTMTMAMCPHIIGNMEYSRSVIGFTDLKEFAIEMWSWEWNAQIKN